MADFASQGYGMAVLAGLPSSILETLVVDEQRVDSDLYIAARNGSDQIVIAGLVPVLDRLTILATARGARRAQLLPIAAPSHTPLMRGVAEVLESAAKRITYREPAIPCVCNSTGRILYTGTEIMDDLVWNVARPVQWQYAMAALYESRSRFFIEMPPGSVLTRLLAAEFSDVRCIAAENTNLELIVKVSEAQGRA
jgi:malonate decarboxylase epsilon subunit